ncbi:monocarboxylate transporter 12 isoform X2 [Eurytemora carolleeae]|uniref:monocarboxylate transporter 12 isoform X2 n=1 Tax=Eurytemora carolleeae TaxID=1294199 RepID=UPI000C787382|nr:monocarboxylate transporter 12 isoform X2 [Eurytemora carolleeae]|eukprot:XP_023340234.1 monocarboxylate transporter 12-like isoform X2 [Eurytemora affinis]
MYIDGEKNGGSNVKTENGKNPNCEKEEEEDNQPIVPPPDGGWGWAVVFASFMIHVIADGITYSFGIFLVELIRVFDSDRGATSLIPSILVGVTLGSGPITASFTNRYGCRAVTIAGAILASAGLALSTLSNSIGVLYFTIGVCTGLGFGLIYLPAIVSVSMYFEKKRAFATGIAVCGSGLGTFIMAPVTKGLINQFGWKGAMLITAGLILNCIIFGAMFRPLQPKSKKKLLMVEEGSEGKVLLENNGNYAHPIQNGGAPVNGEPVPPMRPFAEQTGMNGKYNDMTRFTMSHPAHLNQAESKPRIHFGSHAHFQGLKSRRGSRDEGTGVMNRKDILYGGSLLNIPEYKRDPQGYRRSIQNLPEDAEYPGTQENRICCCTVSPAQARSFNQMADFSLFRDPVFIMYAVSNFLTSIGFNVPYVYTVDRAILWGMDPESASFLLSVIGIANTIGRIILGWIGDQGWVKRLYIYNFCLVLCGITMGLSVFCTTYTTQAMYCAVFGVTSGAYVGLTSVVLTDLLGLDKLTNSFGLILFFQGIASVMGPPVIGALYDAIGDYDAGFYFAGSMIFLSGAMLFFIPPIQRRIDAKPKFKMAQSKSEDDLHEEL